MKDRVMKELLTERKSFSRTSLPTRIGRVRQASYSRSKSSRRKFSLCAESSSWRRASHAASAVLLSCHSTVYSKLHCMLNRVDTTNFENHEIHIKSMKSQLECLIQLQRNHKCNAAVVRTDILHLIFTGLTRSGSYF